MNFLKNIIINIKATGPAAVLISWVLGVALLGIFGKGEIASHGMNVLSTAGVLFILILTQRTANVLVERCQSYQKSRHDWRKNE